MAEDNFLEGNGIIILILFFLMFGGGYGFGGGNGALTRAELQAGLYNQTTDRNLSDIRTGICENQKTILTTASATDSAIAGANYNSLSQFKDLSAQLSSCCCENRLAIANQTNALAQAIHQEGELTRAQASDYRMRDLEKQVSGYELVSALGNQTNTLSARFGTFYPNPPVAPYPYYYTGTTIS